MAYVGTGVECRVCEHIWEKDSEQAISVEMFNECVCCRFVKGDGIGSNSGTSEELGRVSTERERRWLLHNPVVITK